MILKALKEKRKRSERHFSLIVIGKMFFLFSFTGQGKDLGRDEEEASFLARSDTFLLCRWRNQILNVGGFCNDNFCGRKTRFSRMQILFFLFLPQPHHSSSPLKSQRKPPKKTEKASSPLHSRHNLRPSTLPERKREKYPKTLYFWAF